MIECLKMHKENFDYCLGEIIRESEEKDEEIERLENIINEIYTKALDTSITSLDLRDYIITNLGSGKNE